LTTIVSPAGICGAFGSIVNWAASSALDGMSNLSVAGREPMLRTVSAAEVAPCCATCRARAAVFRVAGGSPARAA